MRSGDGKHYGVWVLATLAVVLAMVANCRLDKHRIDTNRMNRIEQRTEDNEKQITILWRVQKLQQ